MINIKKDTYGDWSVSLNIGSGFSVSTLTIVFILLKCFGYINWSWWWVFSPMLISVAFTVFIILVVLIVLLIVWWRDR